MTQTIRFKLTDRTGRTRVGENNETDWQAGVTNRAVGTGIRLCTDDVLHYYDTPRLASFYNIVHANIIDPLCWEVKVSRIVTHAGTKGGCKAMTPLRLVPLPMILSEQRIEIAIRCVLLYYHQPEWVTWAEGWLSGTDRSSAKAIAAANITYEDRHRCLGTDLHKVASAASWVTEAARGLLYPYRDSGSRATLAAETVCCTIGYVSEGEATAARTDAIISDVLGDAST